MRILKSIYEKIGYQCYEVVATELNTLNVIQKKMAKVGRITTLVGFTLAVFELLIAAL